MAVTEYYREPVIEERAPSSSLHNRLERIWETDPGLIGWLSTVDHKEIGIRYLVTAFAFLILGGIEALIFRVQLAQPEQHLLTPEQYDQLFTMHGITMIFLYASPILSGFSNYLWPLLLGARDMALPRLNAFSYWVYLFSGLFHLCELPDRSRAQRRLVQLRPLREPRLQSRAEHGFLRARADLPRALHHGRRDQFHGHDVPHARARHVDQSRADHGVGHAHGVGGKSARGAGGESRLLPALARPAIRHPFLQRA